MIYDGHMDYDEEADIPNKPNLKQETNEQEKELSLKLDELYHKRDAADGNGSKELADSYQMEIKKLMVVLNKLQNKTIHLIKAPRCEERECCSSKQTAIIGNGETARFTFSLPPLMIAEDGHWVCPKCGHFLSNENWEVMRKSMIEGLESMGCTVIE